MPAFLGTQDTYYVGTIKSVGRKRWSRSEALRSGAQARLPMRLLDLTKVSDQV
jgi:hypothetical protein